MKDFSRVAFAKIKHIMPKKRKPPIVLNYRFWCALLYIIENSYK